MNLNELQNLIASNSIDTILVCMVDMQGRLMGKRYHAATFVRHGYELGHACNYLLANDMEMVPVPGYASASWSAGYGDFILRPDFSSLRLLPWLDATALVICDVYSENGQPVAQSPRHILQRQLRRLTDRGMRAYSHRSLNSIFLMRPMPRYQERIITFPRYLEVTIRTIVFCRQRGRSASCVRSETVYMVQGSRLNVQREKGALVRGN